MQGKPVEPGLIPNRSIFAIDRKYARIRDLLIAYVWFLEDPARSVVYALTYPQAVEVGQRMGYTKTVSWKRGTYVNTRPSPRLVSWLSPYQMTPERWWRTVTGTG